MSEIEATLFSEKNKVVGGTLYLVTTPIGNLADITYRAVNTLREVDFIAAEDTRNTAKLLHFFEIQKETVSYHEHNKAAAGEKILLRLQNGESCALVTDAGTPAISDPGEDLVRLCLENHIPVTATPGVSAAVTALTLSGCSTRYFAFEGFLPVGNAERKKRLSLLADEARTLIVYEAPHKLVKTLQDLLSVLDDRKISLCRELTKRNEEVMRTTLSEANAWYQSHEPRGEYVLIIEGARENTKKASFWEDRSVIEHVEYYIQSGLSKNDAIKAAAKDRGVPKNVVYNEYVR